MSAKVGRSANKMAYAKVTFFDGDYVYQASELQPMLSTNKEVYAEDTFCYRDYVSQMAKQRRIYVLGLILLSALKITKHTRVYPATHYCTRL